jgi:hypothetical protein
MHRREQATHASARGAHLSALGEVSPLVQRWARRCASVASEEGAPDSDTCVIPSPRTGQ